MTFGTDLHQAPSPSRFAGPSLSHEGRGVKTGRNSNPLSPAWEREGPDAERREGEGAGEDFHRNGGPLPRGRNRP